MLYDVVQQRHVDLWQARLEHFDPQLTAAEPAVRER